MLTALLLAIAPADAPLNVLHVDGHKLVYTVTQEDGLRVIEGKRIADGAPFRFVLHRDRYVRGTVGDARLSFRMPPKSD